VDAARIISPVQKRLQHFIEASKQLFNNKSRDRTLQEPPHIETLFIERVIQPDMNHFPPAGMILLVPDSGTGVYRIMPWDPEPMNKSRYDTIKWQFSRFNLPAQFAV